MIKLLAMLLLAQAGGPSGRERSRIASTEIRAIDETSFRAAAARAANGDVNIVIDRQIELRRGVSFSAERSVVRIIGVGAAAGLKFDFSRGPAGGPKRADEHGLELHCRQAIIANLEFSGYEQAGSVIKGHASELLSVSGCRFHDIGTQIRPFRVMPARNAFDADYTLCIASHDMDNGHLEVMGCRFERCSSNTWQWSHCVYASGRSITIRGNVFIETGNPLSLGGSKRPGTIQILDNVFENPRGGPNSEGRIRLAFIASLAPNDSYAFVGNRISGMWDSGWTGGPRSALQLIDYNDYSRMEFYDSWAADTGRGQRISWEDWVKMGFDTHSQPPRRSPVPKTLLEQNRQSGSGSPRP